MSIEIVCRRCGKPFAVDVKQTPGAWWLACPWCRTEEQAATAIVITDDASEEEQIDDRVSR